MALELPYSDSLRPTGRLVKPSKLDRQSAKQARKTLIAKAREKELRADMKAWTELRKAVYARDGGLCRAYGTPVKLLTENPLELAHVHHCVFRSAGGADSMSNLALLCPRAHALIHAHLLHCEGNADEALSFTLTDDHGAVIERWVSIVRPR